MKNIAVKYAPADKKKHVGNKVDMLLKELQGTVNP
jgi:hypothetical protein